MNCGWWCHRHTQPCTGTYTFIWECGMLVSDSQDVQNMISEHAAKGRAKKTTTFIFLVLTKLKQSPLFFKKW